MSAIVQSGAFLIIILAGFLLKKGNLVGARDYKVLQTIIFDFTLPAAIVFSFATNPHEMNLLLIALFGLACATVPIAVLFFVSRRRKVGQRAFLMLNGSGFNVGTFCFPVLQVFLGPSSLVVASMFDMGNAVMVTAGLNVMTSSLLRIDMEHTLAEQYQGDAPVVPRPKLRDRDARRIAVREKVRAIALAFLKSPSSDIYLIMIVVMVFNLAIPGWIATILQPVSQANPFISMLMVGMLMELPQTKADVKAVAEVISWRIPLAVIFALAAWYLLPFDGIARKAIVMVCFAPTAIFSTLFTEKVLGSPKLAGFTLATTAMIAIVAMTVINVIVPV